MSNIVIPDGGNIGSASDPDAISIASSGKPTFSAGIANTGTIDAGTLGSSVVFPTGKVIKTEMSGDISGSTTSPSDQLIATLNFQTTVANSKILILGTLFVSTTSGSGNNFIYVILRHTTGSNNDLLVNGYPIVGAHGSADVRGVAAFNFLHEPDHPAGTTSEYQVLINATYAGSTVRVNDTTSPSKIIFMEIAP